jgi:hypothetical protein
MLPDVNLLFILCGERILGNVIKLSESVNIP